MKWDEDEDVMRAEVSGYLEHYEAAHNLEALVDMAERMVGWNNYSVNSHVSDWSESFVHEKVLPQLKILFADQSEGMRDHVWKLFPDLKKMSKFVTREMQEREQARWEAEQKKFESALESFKAEGPRTDKEIFVFEAKFFHGDDLPPWFDEILQEEFDENGKAKFPGW